MYKVYYKHGFFGKWKFYDGPFKTYVTALEAEELCKDDHPGCITKIKYQ